MGTDNNPRKPGRKPKDSKDLLRNHTHFTLSDSELVELQKLSAELGCSQAEVVRRALMLIRQQLDAKGDDFPLELRMSGDAATLEKKKTAIQAFRFCGTLAFAADRAGVTSRTINYWAEKDPVFAELCVEAKAVAVGHVQAKMFQDAMKGNTSAQFGILNAFDPNFGAIRSQMLQQVIRPLIDGVIEHARRLVPDPEVIERLAMGCARIGERIAISATSGKRR